MLALLVRRFREHWHRHFGRQTMPSGKRVQPGNATSWELADRVCSFDPCSGSSARSGRRTTSTGARTWPRGVLLGVTEVRRLFCFALESSEYSQE